ncbi:MAG: PAS domain S-box protein, partial [Desulfobacterales bacterium]|nr:PAS domain S-box protein [Desulfobacterales bacterium]
MPLTKNFFIYNKNRTTARDLILGLTLAVSLTVMILIMIYYMYSSIISKRELNAKAKSITGELTQVLAISLWNLTKKEIKQISESYLQSVYVEGMQVKDDHDHLMFEHKPENNKKLIIREKIIQWQGVNVGSVKLWFTGRDTEKTRKSMIRAMLFIGFSVIIIIISGIHFIMRNLLNKPMNQLTKGIRTIAGGDYESSMPNVPQADINAIIKEVNVMANKISIRNEQLQKEIIVRSNAEEELKKVNETLKLRINQLISTEKALSESEKKYRSIFENALEGIYQTTPDGKLIEANPSMAYIFGFNSSEELIKNNADVEKHYVNPEQRNEYLRLLDERGMINNYECEFYRKDGSKIWGVMQARVFRDDSGKLIRLEGILQDITERKKAEMELRESEEKYRNLYEGSRDGYVRTDINGNILECNSSFCEILGYTWEELKKMNYRQITPVKLHEWERELLKEQTVQKGYTDVYEKEYLRKNGSTFPVEMRAYVIRDKNEKRTGFW